MKITNHHRLKLNTCPVLLLFASLLMNQAK
jgi:hypothetical protein